MSKGLDRWAWRYLWCARPSNLIVGALKWTARRPSQLPAAILLVENTSIDICTVWWKLASRPVTMQNLSGIGVMQGRKMGLIHRLRMVYGSIRDSYKYPPTCARTNFAYARGLPKMAVCWWLTGGLLLCAWRSEGTLAPGNYNSCIKGNSSIVVIEFHS